MFNNQKKEVPVFLQRGELYEIIVNNYNQDDEDDICIVQYFLEDDSIDDFIYLLKTMNYWGIEYSYNEEYIKENINNIIDALDETINLDNSLSILLLKYCNQDNFIKLYNKISYQIKNEYIINYLINNESTIIFLDLYNENLYCDESITNEEIEKRRKDVFFSKNIRLYIDFCDCFNKMNKDDTYDEINNIDETFSFYRNKYPFLNDENDLLSYSDLIVYLMNLVDKLDMNYKVEINTGSFAEEFTLFEYFLLKLKSSNDMIYEGLSQKYISNVIQDINIFDEFIGDINIFKDENNRDILTSDLFFTLKNKKEIDYTKYIPQLFNHHSSYPIEGDINENKGNTTFLHYLLKDQKNRDFLNKRYNWNNIIEKNWDYVADDDIEEENTIDLFMACFKYEVEVANYYSYYGDDEE